MQMVIVNGVRYRPEDAPKDRKGPKGKARTRAATKAAPKVRESGIVAPERTEGDTGGDA